MLVRQFVAERVLVAKLVGVRMLMLMPAKGAGGGGHERWSLYEVRVAASEVVTVLVAVKRAARV